MAESKERTNLLRVVPAIAHEYAFIVLFIPYIFILTLNAWIFAHDVGSDIFKTHRKRERKLARGIDTSGKHVGKRIAGLRTQIPGLDYGRNLVDPRHGHGVAADTHHYQILISLGKSLDHCVLAVR